MRSKIFILLFITSQLFANVECYNLDDYVDDGKDLTELTKIISQKAEYDARNSCISDGGQGSTFIMETPLFVRTCLGQSESKSGYLKFQFGCDYCTSEKINDELNNFEKECADACMSSDAYCEKADLIYEGGWDCVFFDKHLTKYYIFLTFKHSTF